MSDDITTPNTARELSEQELESVSGGIDVFFAGSFYQENTISLTQQTSSTPNGSSTASDLQSTSITSFAFQFIGLGLDSLDEAALLKYLNLGLGRES